MQARGRFFYAFYRLSAPFRVSGTPKAQTQKTLDFIVNNALNTNTGKSIFGKLLEGAGMVTSPIKLAGKVLNPAVTGVTGFFVGCCVAGLSVGVAGWAVITGGSVPGSCVTGGTSVSCEIGVTTGTSVGSAVSPASSVLEGVEIGNAVGLDLFLEFL